MGIDYRSKSKKNPTMFESEMDFYLKYALRDVKWTMILDSLNIHLGLLADCRINYWAPEQVKDMYESIVSLLDPEEAEFDIQTMKTDIEILAAYFKILVENEAYIYVI